MKYIWIFFFALSIQVGFGQAAQLDATFGGSGYVISGGSTVSADKILLQHDGKILAIGDTRTNFGAYNGFGFEECTEIISIYRYQADGSTDYTFGYNGKVQFISGTTYPYYHNPMATLQPDGKILISTTLLNADSNFDFALYRFNTDGSRDSTFGINGLTTAGFDTFQDIAADVVVLPDNKILQCGNSSKMSDASDAFVMLAKYQSNGTLDTTFGIKGVEDSMYKMPYVHHMKLFSSGKVLIPYYDQAIFFSDTDGAFRGGFTLSATTVSGFNIIEAVAEVDSGRIIAACSYGVTPSNAPITILKFHNYSILDSSFGGIGHVEKYFLPSSSVVEDATVLPDGKILVLVNAFYYDTTISSNASGPVAPYIVSNASMCVAKFLPNGSVDSSFADNGVFLLDTTMISGQYCASMTVQPDGKILILGNGHTTGQGGLVTLRLLNTLSTGLLTFDSKADNTMVYPNPIHHQATLSYTLADDETISIALYDLQGRKVQDITSSEHKDKGTHSKAIDIADNIAPGNYIVRIDNGNGNTGVKVIVR